jgi:chromosome segregation ATPase
MADIPTQHDAQHLATCSAAALRALEERARSALAVSREHVSRLEQEITGQLEAIAVTLAKEQEAESQQLAHASELQTEVERLTGEFEAAQADWSTEQAELTSANDALSQQVAKLESEQRASREDWSRQLADFERRLREQQGAWNEQRDEWTEARTKLESELSEIQQKFELALEDVQRYRGRVADLEQELARRPEGTAADSAELVALRAERDALSERVEQLEKQSATQVDASSDQQMADLQRRFELAVEDVRELKTKNARLESQLAAGGGRTERTADAGGMDWESQKRRLLASLEDEGDTDDEPQRQDERVRISDTIEMTDEIVAAKDREIEELKAQLVEQSGSTSVEEAYDEKIGELIDADEVITEHRQRIAQLERDMEATLRAAELELSLERAKIARERVELDELRADLDAQRQELGANGATSPGAPRRKWLSKLGLNGEET